MQMGAGSERRTVSDPYVGRTSSGYEPEPEFRRFQSIRTLQPPGGTSSYKLGTQRTLSYIAFLSRRGPFQVTLSSSVTSVKVPHS